jgi:hypothetical protein
VHRPNGLAPSMARSNGLSPPRLLRPCNSRKY